MDWLKEELDLVDQETTEQDEYEPKGGPAEAGIYDVQIVMAYVKTFESGAKFLNFEFETKDEKKVYWNNIECLVTDSAGNTGWTDSDNKKHPYSGIVNINRICSVLGLEMKDLKPEKVKIELFGKEIEVEMFKELLKKKIKIGVQQQKSLTQDNDIRIQNGIVGIMNPKGEYKGENILEKTEKRLERTPLKDLSKKDKAKIGQGSNNKNKKSDSSKDGEEDNW